MITDLIIGGFIGFIRALTDLIPTFTLPVPTGNGSVLSIAGSLNSIIPLNHILIAFFACVVVRLALAGWDALVWVYHQFWGSS